MHRRDRVLDFLPKESRSPRHGQIVALFSYGLKPMSRGSSIQLLYISIVDAGIATGEIAIGKFVTETVPGQESVLNW